jgi:hypothetical protein
MYTDFITTSQQRVVLWFFILFTLNIIFVWKTSCYCFLFAQPTFVIVFLSLHYLQVVLNSFTYIHTLACPQNNQSTERNGQRDMKDFHKLWRYKSKNFKYIEYSEISNSKRPRKKFEISGCSRYPNFNDFQFLYARWKRDVLWTLWFYGVAMSVRFSVRPSVRPSHSW